MMEGRWLRDGMECLALDGISISLILTGLFVGVFLCLCLEELASIQNCLTISVFLLVTHSGALGAIFVVFSKGHQLALVLYLSQLTIV